MFALEEGGEENICSLLNTLIHGQFKSDSELDLSDYLDAVAELEHQGKAQLVEDQTEVRRVIHGEIVFEYYSELRTMLEFDAVEGSWAWKRCASISVRVADA